MTRRQFLYGIAATSTTVGLFQYGAADQLVVENHELQLPRWDVPGFRVAVLADLHVDNPRRTKRAMRACQLALESKPDVVLIAGDHASSTESHTIRSIEATFDLFRGAHCPVLAVMGNHDYWGAMPQKLIRVIKSSSVRLLQNESIDIGGVCIAGVDDALMKRHRLDFFPEDQCPKSVIVLLHEPDYVEDVPTHGSLQISGHSHGGQICLPLGGAVHTPRGARKYTRGFYGSAPIPLFVSRGVGTTGPDVRLFCKPEVSILTLQPA